ncbi:MAG: hypothetical protein P8Z79_00095 [Sedimentisphaerales bacterium]|jgi:chromatin segregation and condensation protein Rec8/ScpA/Scc1 (kleisin family)
MKQKVVLACLIALFVSPVLTGCCDRAEFTRTKARLEQIERERDYLQSRVAALQKAQTAEAGVPGQLQQQVDEFMKIRDALQQREDELAKLREAALAEAQTAQTLMENLSKELKAETQKVSDLQSQLQQAQQAITELQSKLQ